MHGRFPYKLLSKYPRLMPEDRAIWERFILKYPNMFDTVDYDVHVGYGNTNPNHPDRAAVRDFQHLTKKRIDAVGYKDNQICIIEVKPRASLGAIGQVIGYEALYRETEKWDGPIQKMIVTDMKLPDIHSVCNCQDIKLYIA